jgi:hypothetical protein
VWALTRPNQLLAATNCLPPVLCCRNLNALGYGTEAAAAAVEVDALVPAVRALQVSQTTSHSISVTWAAGAGYVSSYVVSFSRLVSAAGWAGIGVLSHPGLPPSLPRASCFIMSKPRMVVLCHIKLVCAPPDQTWPNFLSRATGRDNPAASHPPPPRHLEQPAAQLLVPCVGDSALAVGG